MLATSIEESSLEGAFDVLAVDVVGQDTDILPFA
jgi:hypothetical protein